MGNTTLDELRPMVPDAHYARVPETPLNIEITNPRHFLRTLQFAEDNRLLPEFSRSFNRLLNLLVQTGGVIWPDGRDVPGFTWRGSGMVGGFIFHPASRDWSIHT